MNKKDQISFNKKETPFLFLGHLSFLILFIFSCIFFSERVIFADSAFQFFKIINFEKINLEASRYGAILPQIPLLLAMKLGVNLKGLTIIYSFSFILLYYLVFICCVYLLKNIPAGLAVIIVLILSVSQSFFHPVTETHQSLVFSVLLYAVLQYTGFRSYYLQLFLAIGVVLLAFFAHPVAIYPIVFIIGYVAIDKKQLRTIKPYILVLLVAVLAISKVLLTEEDSYEGQFFSELMNSPAIILDLPDLASTTFFVKRIDTLYFWTAMLQLMLIGFFIYRKKYDKLFWQLITLVFFLVVTLITYSRGDSVLMMERAFMPLALFIAVPLLEEIVKSRRYFVYSYAFLAVIVSISFTRIYQQGVNFQERTRFNKEMLTKTSKFQNGKFIADKEEVDKYIISFWSHSFETLILSSISEGIPVQTIYLAPNPQDLKKYTADSNYVFLGASFWLEWNINDLNSRYFDLPENTAYKIINI